MLTMLYNDSTICDDHTIYLQGWVNLGPTISLCQSYDKVAYIIMYTTLKQGRYKVVTLFLYGFLLRTTLV